MKLFAASVLAVAMLSGCNAQDNHSAEYKEMTLRSNTAYELAQQHLTEINGIKECKPQGESYLVAAGMPCDIGGLVASVNAVKSYAVLMKELESIYLPTCKDDSIKCKTMFELRPKLSDAEFQEFLKVNEKEIRFMESLPKLPKN